MNSIQLTEHEVVELPDFQRAAAIRNQWVKYHKLLPEEMLTFSTEEPEGNPVYRGLLTDEDGQDVVYFSTARAYWTSEPGLFQFGMSFVPSSASRDLVEAALAKADMHLERLGAQKTTSWVNTYHPEYCEWLCELGFTSGQVNPVTAAELSENDYEEWAIQYPVPAGLGVVSAADLERLYPETWLQMTHEFESLGMVDVPLPYPYEPVPLETFAKEMLGQYTDRSTILYLMDGDRLVCGTAFGVNRVDPSTAGTFLTTTLREYRRQGLARALKIYAMQLAKSRGVLRLFTDNEESNPMLQLNLALGFKPIHNSINFLRELK